MRRRIATPHVHPRSLRALVFAGAVSAALLVSASPARGQVTCDDLLQGAPIGSGCFETPAGAELIPPSGGFDPIGPSQPSSGSFAGIFVVVLLIGGGIAIWKFMAIRDMGMRRGMSSSDATTAAIFSEDPIMLGMVLKDETTTAPHASAPEQPVASAAGPSSSFEERLTKIDELVTQGLITEAQAAQRKAEILDEI